MDILVREMTMEDYDQVYKLWTKISGFRIRSIDDSREGVERFLKRNPTTSVVAVQNGHIIGNILCGHDGRTGCFYHVCVEDGYRHHGIGYKIGNAFWQGIGWTEREDFNSYEFILNEENIIRFVK